VTARATFARRVFGGAVAVSAVGVLAAPLFRMPAPALRDSFPADGAVVAVAPGEVRLGLTSAARRDDVHVGLVDQRGLPVALGPPRTAGTDVVLSVPDLDPGRYLVSYHVGLISGGAVAGSVAFAVGDGTDRPAAAGPGGGHLHGGAIDPLSGAVIFADLVVLGGIAAVEFRRRVRT